LKVRAWKKAFPFTLPVLAGYLSLGIAFGLLMQQNGFGVGWVFLSSCIIYAGSAQFLGVGLLTAGASLLQTAVVIFILNFRHFFYGLSMITQYRQTGAKKSYLIFGLTDETYAILSTTPTPPDVPADAFYLWVTLLDHLYWIAGSVLGATVGGWITVNTEGLDFAMTALFAVLFVEQWKTHPDHRAQVAGLAVILLSLKLLGPEQFLIPGLIVLSVILLLTDAMDTKKQSKGGDSICKP